MAQRIGLDAVQEINSNVALRLHALEESTYSWLDEILDEAKKAFGSEERSLLPQTPSVKRRGRRRKSTACAASRKKINLGDCGADDAGLTKADSLNRSQSRKRVPNTDLSLDGDADDQVSSSKVIIIEEEIAAAKEPVGRRTRATSKAATTKPRSTRPPRARKAKSQEPVLNIEIAVSDDHRAGEGDNKENVGELPKTPESRIPSVDGVCTPQSARVTEWVQSTGHSVLSLKHRMEPQQAQPVGSHKPSIECFNQMTVKEKAQAYEEIVLISPRTPVVAAPRQVTGDSRDGTPGVAPSPCTPDTVKVPQSGPVQPPSCRDLVGTPVSRSQTGTESGHQNGETRLPDSRASMRRSHRLSLKTLPSEDKLQKPGTEKPTRPRTRLRLKKKEAPVESGSEECSTQSEEDGHTGTDNSHIEGGQTADTAHKDVARTDAHKLQQARHAADSGAPVEPMHVEVAEVRASTRTKTRHASKTESQSSVMSVTESDSANYSADDDDVQQGPSTVKSTRTKTRAVHAQPAVVLHDIAATKCSKKDSGLGEIDRQGTGSCSSADGDGIKRVTRSKMRKPPIQPAPASDTCSSDDAFSSPQAPAPRATRTKTRKRQHEEGSDTEMRRPKRSCTDSDLEPQTPTNRTPTNHIQTYLQATDDDDSSDSDLLSPKCPRGKVGPSHVQSFLSQLKPLNNPIRPASVNRGGGLVRSFIARNSPVPKPSQKELQERRKKDLQEKEKKNQERLRKRDEEYKKHMEEIKRRREEKNKKVQHLREMNEVREQENRAILQRRLAEKKEVTVKLREDRIREEREKHKTRQQRCEEAEERRRQEEDERRRKLREQLESERAHQEMVQRKRDFEEQERQRRIADDRRRQQEHLERLEREKEEEKDKQRQVEEQRTREWQKRREEREKMQVQLRMEKERQDLERKKERDLQLKKEMERLREQEKKRQVEQDRLAEQQRQQEDEIRHMVHKHNQAVQSQAAPPPSAPVPPANLPRPNLNRTHSIGESTVQQNEHKNSYELTPDRVPKPATSENYDISDLTSGDETDDEDAPMKKVPDWATGNNLKTTLIKNHFNPPRLDELFGEIDDIDLNKVFAKKKARFNKRTSSAHWDSPILKPAAMSCRKVNVV